MLEFCLDFADQRLLFLVFLDLISKYTFYGGIMDKNWEDALQNVNVMMGYASEIPMGFFYVAECKRMIRQYNNGDRSDELYEEMQNLH